MNGSLVLGRLGDAVYDGAVVTHTARQRPIRESSNMLDVQKRIDTLAREGYWVGGTDAPTLRVGDTVTTKGFSPMVGRIVDLYGVSAVVRIDGRTLTYGIDRIVRVDA